MGLGGPFLFIGSMHLSNAFPRNSGQVLSILTGSFDASSSIFLMYRLAYYNGFKISPHKFFLVYLFFPILSIIVQVWFMPKDSYKSEFEIVAEAADAAGEPQETTSLLSDEQLIHHYIPATGEPITSGAVEAREIMETYGSARRASVFTIPKNRWDSYDEQFPRFKNPVTGAMQGKKSLEQIKSPWWMYLPQYFTDLSLMSLFVMMMMVRINYYIATVWPKARYLLGDMDGEKVNHLFDVALPRIL
jgi:hypothetical protein